MTEPAAWGTPASTGSQPDDNAPRVGYLRRSKSSSSLPANSADGVAMPICEIDPWRLQYFRDARCPPDVSIPTEDSDAWEWNPRHRWVYDKIAVALSQGLAAGPHGTKPPGFPVFSKPITNLKGMGIGTQILYSDEDYGRSQTAGHMWMTLLEGAHVSSDVAVVRGEPRWWRHARGVPTGQGTFDYWLIQADRDPVLEGRLGEWVTKYLGDYTGMVNIETIGGFIIEIHLRLTDQWPDLYGSGWIDAVVNLYDHGEWVFDEHNRQDGFSVVLFGPHGRQYRHPDSEFIESVRAMAGVSSLQITFDQHRAAALHAMPPGGFRLAIVNSNDLSVGINARQRLRAHFLG